MGRICLLQPAGRKHCSSKDENGCSTPDPLMEHRGVRPGLSGLNDARDPPPPQVFTLDPLGEVISDRVVNLVPFVM